MLKHKQLFRHRPEDGQIGDCFRSTIACLLNMRPEEVPHFVKDAIENGEELAAAAYADKWLMARGYSIIEFPLQAPSVEEALKWANSHMRNTYYMLSGTSRNAVNHVVICLKDKIHWDTAQDDSGIIGPTDDGYYWLSVIITGFQGE